MPFISTGGIRIRIKLTGRIRVCITVTSRIRKRIKVMRIRNTGIAFTLVRAFNFFLRYLSKFPSDNRTFFLSQALVWRVWATFPALVHCTLTIMKKYSGKRLKRDSSGPYWTKETCQNQCCGSGSAWIRIHFCRPK